MAPASDAPPVWDLVVIGAGAAGLIGAARAAERGRTTLLLEKNRHAGIKILMSGGTRCNLTQATDERGIIEAFGARGQGRFLHSALAALSPAALVQLVENEGVPTKIEATGKIFPASDQARDIVAALLRRLERSGARLALEEPVTLLEHLLAVSAAPSSAAAIAASAPGAVAQPVEPVEPTLPAASAEPPAAPTHEARFRVHTVRGTHLAQSVLVTTGGRSYPGSGTSGDAYPWLAALGHTIVPTRPALTPITTHAAWVRELQGVTLPDVVLRVLPASAPDEPPPKRGRQQLLLAERRGSLLCTHFGLSGPVALDVSRAISGHAAPQSLVVVCDLLPERDEESLDTQLRLEAAGGGKRTLIHLLAEHLPRRVAEAVCQIAQVETGQRMAELAKPQRRRIAASLKRLRIPVAGTMGFRKAEVTAGGVDLREVDSHTMQSKRVPGLYLAGEVLDLDGPIGGYNFQAAFSTGYLAGQSV